jgi:endoribonuclease Dicer
MRRIDDMLLVIELNGALFDHSIQKDQLHAAVSAPSACTEFDYERLELLGDSYLKYLSSIYLFVTNPAQHEGALHSARLRIISNKALFLDAESVGLAPYIQARPLVSKQWSPPNFTVIPPPPPKISIVGGTPTVNEDSTGREMGAEGSEAQGDEVEEKAHDRMSQGWCLGIHPDLFDLSVTVDGIKSSDSVVDEGMVAEKSTRETETDEGAPQGEASKLPVEQQPSKKSKKDDQNVQWLGEKVISTKYQ